MKKAIIFAAVLMAGVTFAGTPLQAKAAPVQPQANTAVVKKVVAASGNTLKECLDKLSKEQLKNYTVITIPCVPGTGDEKPGVDEPDTPENKPSQPETGKPGEDAAQGDYHAYVLRVVELVNEERAKAGLNPLTLQKNITQAAQIRAVESEQSFSHTRPNGTSFSTALTEAGVSYRGSGENIAWGQKSPEEVMRGWMNSPGHRANIMNAKFTSIGVGYHQNAGGTNYWSQLFTY